MQILKLKLLKKVSFIFLFFLFYEEHTVVYNNLFEMK